MLTLQRTAASVRTERETIAMVYNYGNGRTSIEHVPAVPASLDSESDWIPEPDCDFFYTTAPVDYDGFGTKTIRENCGVNSMGKVWRLIQIRNESLNWQDGRNGSGLHPTVSVADFHKFRHLYVEEKTAVPAPVVPESTIPEPAIAIVDSIAVELAERERKNAERELKRILETDWNSDPRTWSTKACAYYLGTICGMHLVTGIQDKENELELRAMVVDEFRKRNTETASVTLNRSDLLNAVRTAKKLNPRNPAKTVSLSVNGSIDVITSDNEARFCQCLAYAQKSGELRLTFPEQQLTAIASKLASKTLELTLVSVPALSENVLSIAGGSAKFELNVERPEPETRFQSAFPATFAHNVSAGELLHSLNMTIFATSTESTRYALAGLCFVPDSDSLDIAATDSRRLAVETVPAQLLGTMPELKKGETEQSKRFTIVPGNIIQILMDELKRVPAASIVSFAVANAVYSRFPLTVPDNLTPKQLETWETEQLKESHIERDSETGVLYCCSNRPEFVFECQNAFSIRGMELEGRFPRYRDIIPSSFNSEFTVDRAELLNACETVELSTTKESRGVDFSLPAPGSESIIILRGKSSTAKGQFICDCIPEVGGIGEVITFDPQYVSEYLKRSKSDRIRLHVTDCNSCVMFTQETEHGNGSGKHIIMPLSQDR